MSTDVIGSIKPRKEFADILRRDERYAPAIEELAGPAEPDPSINARFDRLMLQSGMGIAPSMMLALCVAAGLLTAGAVFVWQENPLTTAMAGVFGAFLPILVAIVKRSRRQAAIVKQLPEMIEELSRATRAGQTLEKSITMVAEDTEGPLGEELELCARKLELGLPVAEAIKELPDRTGVDSLRVFNMALTVHQESGGNIVTVLERLATTIRDRTLYLGRLRAATAASRATAWLMMILPPAILLFFTLRDPAYVQRLFDSRIGTVLTITACTLLLLGMFAVRRILKSCRLT